MPSNSKRPKKERAMPDMPITFEYQMSIRGGCLKQATVIPMDVAVHGGTERRFTLVPQRTPWLCEMVSGLRHWCSPLKRASMLRRLKKLLMKHGIAATAVLDIAPVMDDKMAGFRDSDDEQPAAKPQARGKRLKEDLATQTVIEVTVQNPRLRRMRERGKRDSCYCFVAVTCRSASSSMRCRGLCSSCRLSFGAASMSRPRNKNR